jgi:hypothetical protein
LVKIISAGSNNKTFSHLILGKFVFMGGDGETINTLYWMWKTLVAAEIGVWVGMFFVT